jgi:hypothetical protein
MATRKALDIDWAAELDAAAPPDRVCEALARALNAITVGKDGNPIPDYRTQLQAALGFLAHRRGRPAEAPEPKPDEKGVTRSVTDLSDDALAGIMATLGAEQKRRAGKDPL